MTLPWMLPSSALYGLLQTGPGRRTQMAELLLHPCPRLLTRPDGTPATQAQAAGHPLRSFKNPPRILDLFQESWRILQDFENLPNNLGGPCNTGFTDGLHCKNVGDVG